MVDEAQDEFVLDPGTPTSVIYPRLTQAVRRGRPLPPEVHRCCGFVAAAVVFPRDPVVHRYDRVYPHETVQDRQTGKMMAVGNALPVARNDPALARDGVARLVRCIPLCSAVGYFHELSPAFAFARGASACEECWPDD